MIGISWRKNNKTSLGSSTPKWQFLYFFVFLFLLLPSISYGATEFVSIIDPDDAEGTDYTSLSAWEQAVQTDLTATTTLVFSVSSSTGTTTDGVTITGQTSGATGTVLHLASSSEQILIENISGTFQNGEIISTGYGTSTITATGTQAIAVAQCRSTGGTADTNAVTIDGWTTSSTTYIKIWTDPSDPYGRHNGKWDEGKYQIKVSYDTTIRIKDYYVIVDGLQVYNINSGDWTDKGIWIDSGAGGNVTISNNIIRSDKTNHAWVNGIALYAGDSGVTYIYNNIVYDFTTNSTGGGIYFEAGAWTSYVYNNTVSDTRNCFTYISGTVNLYNNIAQNCTIGYNGSFIGGANNLSFDDTATGTGAVLNTTVQFLDATNDDFHLSPNDTSARNAGTSSPLTDSNLSFYADIDGTTRGSAWDIGADEAPVEFVSTICENISAGGDCTNLDYQTLSQWEDAVETDLTASTTRVFSGTLTGSLNENNLVYFIENGTSTGSGYVVATTSDQILIDGITSSSSLPLMSVASGTRITYNASNYFTVQGATTTDELGASPIAIAKIDGAWVSADTNKTTINNWTTDNDNYIKIYTTDIAQHNGKWDDTAYRIEYTAIGPYSGVIDVYEDYVILDGLQISSDDNGFNDIRIINMDNSSVFSVDSNIVIKNNIMKTIVSRYAFGVLFNNNVSGEIYNNIFYNFGGGSSNSNTIYADDVANLYIYSNTFFNCDTGIRRDDGNVVIKNNIISSTTDPFYGTFHASSTNNATDGTDTPTGGSNTITNATINFVSIASGTEDFHLDMTKDNSDIINAGAYLDNDPYINFSTDIDGAARDPDDMGWDIGADEIPAKQYRSVGNTAGDISNGGTVTISSTTRTATFSTAQPDNVGVGDVIQYGGSGYYQLAFITSRASSTEYGVQAYDTKAPSATTSASMVIYKAYLLLDDWEDASSDGVVGDVNSGIDSVVNDLVLVNPDLVASNTTMMVPVYASDSGDTTAVTIDGWTTGAQNYIKVYTPVNTNEVGITQRHSGKWDDGKYWLKVTGNNSALAISERYVRIDGVQVVIDAVTGYTHSVFDIVNVGSDDSVIMISNSIGRQINIVDPNNWHNGIKVYENVSGVTLYAWNNILYDFSGTTNNQSGIELNGLYTAYLYNNTIYNSYYGIRRFGIAISPVAQNNISQNNTFDYSGTFDSSSSNNISSDSTAPGANSKANTTVSFIDPTNKDFHLSPDDTTAIDAGINLSTSTTLSFTDDIDGNYRRTWDIGADEASIDFVTTVEENGNGDFTTLASWEDGIDSDIKATTTAVFSITGDTGTFTPGNTFIGQTSNATGTLVNIGSSSDQVLLSDIQGTFISGEDISDGNGTTTLSDAGNPANAVAKIDGTWSSPDTTAVTIDGWTTGPNNHIRIYTTDTARHNGKWDDGKYRIEVATVNGDIIGAYGLDIIIDGLQIRSVSVTGYQSYGISTGGNAKVIISNNIIRYSGNNNSSYNAIAIGNNVDNLQIYNNIIYDFHHGIYVYSYDGGDHGYIYIYNNTVFNSSDIGIRGDWHSHTYAKNNIAYNNTIDYYGTFDASSDYNISSDSTAPGANSKTNTTVTFLDADNDDFHLSTTDTMAKDAGVEITSIADIYTDIDGNSRYDIGWDIGADEAPTILYRSVGLQSVDLNTGGETVDIGVATGSATAVFSGNMADNIGVGDVIEYGSPLSLAFIVGRTSSTTYSIQSATGTAPIATTSASASVYRAHEHLDDWEDQVAGDVNQVIDASLQSDVLVSQDLVASNTAMFVPCYASTSADDLVTSVDGWTTATTSYIKIYTPKDSDEVGISQRHNGVWSDDKYRLAVTANSNDRIIHPIIDYIKIEGLQLSAISNGYCMMGIGLSYSDGKDVDISKNIIIADGDMDTECYGVFNGANNSTSRIYNNVLYGWKGSTSTISAMQFANGSTNYIYNNTVYDNNNGVYRYNGTMIVKNNAVFNNIDDFVGTFTILDHNASDDLDGTNAIDISPGAVEADDWDKAFKDYANYDFHIKNTSSVLYNFGTTTDLVTDDIIGNTRPFAGYFDIGAFEHTPLGQIRMHGNVKMRGNIKFR